MEHSCRDHMAGTSAAVRCRCASEGQTDLIQAICGYLRMHYRQQSLSLSELSSRVYVSSAYLSTLFHKCTGKSFKSYLVELRMQKACELLLSTDLYIYQIARQTGYPNSQYFSVAFRKHTGCSPSKYRERYRRYR